MTNTLTADQANAIYDILTQHAGAHEDGRSNFVTAQTGNGPAEYRFQGSLGFGGKFWRTTGMRRTDRNLSWRVTCYEEDRTPDRDVAVEATNRALAGLLARQETAA
ncbi:hypothetical protein [Actinoplanes rectilineatus]|uniref:hypothetical protein n=1 Tax=Actinoplanes rectilineatus TaxID=113571 RepID=UPI0005F2D4CF|nr:hypothetical protein [Actinoplanes rectilineatus]